MRRPPEPGPRTATSRTTLTPARPPAETTGNLPNNGAGAAGAAYSNRNQSTLPNNGAGAAGAAYSNRNQSTLPNNGAGAAGAAAGAHYANNNNSGLPNNGAGAAGAAAGARYANNNNGYNNLGAGAMGAALGAGYANNNNGYWNGNYGMGGYGGVGAWGTGSPAYGYGYSSYSNPYYGGGGGDIGGGQPVAQPTAGPSYDYSQPLNTAAADPAPVAVDQGAAALAQARTAFQANDYATALQLTQQALAQTPNDSDLHEFLALVLFAQGQYEKAAAPLYAVLSIGPGWNWTSLITNYSDASLYTKQLRALEAYVKANPRSASAEFVLAYQYIAQGQGKAAIKPLESVVKLQPTDTLSPQLLAKLDPSAASIAPAPAPTQEFDPGKLAGTWVAQPPNAKITLAIKDGGAFEWSVAAAGKPAMTIKGTASVSNGVLTLASDQANAGNMAGTVAWQDDKDFNFRAVGAAANDPGLKFAR